MAKTPTIFLTFREAVDAICIDFRQYEPQIMLFAEVLRLISNDTLHLKRKPEQNGAWINDPGRTTMHWMEGRDLTAYMCDAVVATEWTAELMVAVSRRVFQSRAEPAVDPATGEAGIRIEVNMEDFHCRQCGHCCRSLDYHSELNDADVAHWRESGRKDILEWVAVTTSGDGKPAYRIWVSPETARIVTPCPFLKQDPDTRRWLCRIHDVKPGICRQYPVSRKHARMTGCPGFHRQPAQGRA
jgi:Fe-S-cluster containining protein